MANLFTCPDSGFQGKASDRYIRVLSPRASCGMIHTMPVTSGARHGKVLGIVVAILAILISAAILAVLFPPVIQTIRATRQQAQCADQMKELGIAMLNYYSEHDSFPPAYLVDKDGKPMHSWRVLLLPWLGKKGLYNQYRFEEPWNSPHNMDIGKKLDGDYFRCPSDADASSSETSYMMIVGPGTISDGTSVSRIGNGISDGVSNTILLVEVTNSGASWWEPRDLDASQMSFKINSASAPRSAVAIQALSTC